MRHEVLWSEAEIRDDVALDILDHVAHPVFVKDRQLRYVMLNRAFAEMVGLPREAMLGKTDLDFVPLEQARLFRQMDEQMFASGQLLHTPEEHFTDVRGNHYVVATTKAPLKRSDGTTTHVVGIIQDITWIKQAQDRLTGANQELERRVEESTRALEAARDELLRKERLAVLGRLAGGLAHQIRNPLAAVLNASALLKRHLGESKDPQVAVALKMLEEEAWAANRIISDLVDYARVRRSQPVAAGLVSLVDQALAANAAPAKVDIMRRMEPSSVNVDPLQVVSALGNLVRNAYDAMPSGGTLRVESREDGPFAVLALEDTGPGFTPEVEARLFDPLVTTKPLGLGLGLTTARMLIEGQAGRLMLVQARPHARLEVWLPRV